MMAGLLLAPSGQAWLDWNKPIDNAINYSDKMSAVGLLIHMMLLLVFQIYVNLVFVVEGLL